ncbi:uncharacterized protein LOC134267990 [Saccostrea cucullata]|uniref:uncharacterized protein LOC134267990 n=1 Tax=Saccostrea cuccullata TaxID=36930 RepID=UPI002ED03980
MMDCPKNESMWKKESKDYYCRKKEAYHCLLDDGGGSVKRGCVELHRLGKGHCPIFNRYGSIHWIKCNSPECPNTTYISNEVYRYPVCLQRNSTFTSSTIGTPYGISKSSNFTGESTMEHAGLKVGLLLSMIIIGFFIAIVIAVYYRKTSKRNDASVNDDEEMQQLTRQEHNEAVKTVVKKLERTDKVIIHGKLGTGVSNTGKNVIRSFANSNAGWKPEHLHYRDNLEPSLTDGKIVFIDGWFGIWNPNPSEKNKVIRILRIMKEKMLSLKRGTCKIVIGLRTDVYERYQQIFIDAGMVEDPLDLNSARKDTHQEKEKHLNDALLSNSCKRSKCDCKKLNLEDFKKYTAIGDHLKIDILAGNHELISKFLISGDLLQTLVSHFDDLKMKNKQLYGCLMYIVVKGKFRVGDTIDQGIQNTFELELDITEDCFRQCENLGTYTKCLSRSNLVNVEEEPRDSDSHYFVFKHVFLYICAFHSLFRSHPFQVMEHCNIDAVLQIVRPFNSTDGYGDKFCVKADEKTIKFFYENVVECNNELEELINDHPLVVIAVGSRV